MVTIATLLGQHATQVDLDQVHVDTHRIHSTRAASVLAPTLLLATA